MKLSSAQIAQYSNRDFLHDHFPTGLLCFEPEGKIISINQTLAHWTGKKISELISTDFRNLLAQPSMLYYDLFISPQLSINGLAEEYSLKFISEDEPYDALLNAKCHHDENGKILVVIASVQRITNRKKYEAELLLESRISANQVALAQSEKQHFEFLFGAFPNNFWTVDPIGHVLNMNAKAASVFNMLKDNRLGLFAAVHKPDLSRALATWRRCLLQERKFEKEMRLLNDDGTCEWHLVTAEPYYNQQQQIQLWFCSTININRQKLLQLANQHELKSHLSNVYQNLDRNTDLLLEIASDQSHMIRKPVANLIGLLALLDLDKASLDKQLLDMLQKSAAELDQMIRKISAKTAQK